MTRVVDVSNSPSFGDPAVMKFFEASTRNLLAQEAAAGVRPHVYSIVHATQFFEFLKQVTDISSDGNKVRLPVALSKASCV